MAFREVRLPRPDQGSSGGSGFGLAQIIPIIAALAGSAIEKRKGQAVVKLGDTPTERILGKYASLSQGGSAEPVKEITSSADLGMAPAMEADSPRVVPQPAQPAPAPAKAPQELETLIQEHG